MEISEFRGFSEFSGMEDPSQWSFDSINMEAAAAAAAAFLDNTHHAPMFHHLMESPSQQLKSSWNSHYYPNPKEKEEGTVSSRSTVLGFTSPGGVHLKTNNPPQYHILAERKRRQKLSQRFIALSALLPGLKKMDKASVLGDAINYLKNLQEKVKALEEQTAKSVESVVLVKRCDDGGGGGEFIASSGEPLPEVEARFSGKDVLIRIHCEKKTGVVEETLAELERLHLSVINTNAMAFATYALDITVVAQMNQEFTMTMKDLVKDLCARLKRFM